MKKVILSLIFIFLLSCPAFASDLQGQDDLDVFPLAPDLDSVESYKVADEIYPLLSEDTRAEYTVSDIYTLLYDVLRAQRSDNAWGIPTLVKCMIGSTISNVPTSSSASILGRLATISSNIGGLYTNLKSIHEILNGSQTDIYVRPDIQSCLFRTSSGDFITLSQDLASVLEIAQLSYASLSQIHGDGQNITYQLTQANSLIDEVAEYASNIDSSISSLHNLNWSTSGSVVGLSNTIDGSLITTSGYQTGDLFFRFHVNGYSSSKLPGLLQVFVPVICPWDSTTQNYVSNYAIVNTSGTVITEDIEVLTFHNGYYFICYDFYNQTRNDNNDYILRFSVGDVPSYYTYGSGTIRTLPINTIDYHIWANRHYNKKTSESLTGLDKLAEVYASNDFIQAKQAQQDVEDEAIDEFTGSGSESVKVSDIRGVKSISGNVKSFLSTGARLSDIVGIFDVNGTGLWVWFSQTTADNTDTTVRNRSDEYISIYDLNMEQYLNNISGNSYAESR